MQTKASTFDQTSFLMPALGEQLDPLQPLKQLADRLPWSEFEQAFGKYYSAEGRPAKLVRLMVGLLLLKQMYNQGDETVAAAWNLKKWRGSAALFCLQLIGLINSFGTSTVSFTHP
jgi:IS5 family transposase